MEFVEPTPNINRPNRHYWAETVEKLKANPMKWGRTKPQSEGVANHIRKGRYSAFAPPEVTDREKYIKEHWEIIGQRCQDDPTRSFIFIRWIGNE